MLSLLLVGALAGPAAAESAPGNPTGVSLVPVATSPHLTAKGQALDFAAVAPGKSVSETLVLRNIGAEPAQVRLYVVDATTAVNGGLAFGLANDRPTGIGSWAAVSAPMVTVPGRGAVPLTLRVSVPGSVPGGGYAGGVVAEQVEAGPAPSSGGVRQVYRFAMPVYLTVPGGAPGATPGRGTPGGTVTVVDVELPEKDGTVCPSVSYRNDSQAVANPQARITVDPPFLGGATRRTFSGIGAVLPGASVTTSLPCVALPSLGGKVTLDLSGPHVTPSTTTRDLTEVPLQVWVAFTLLLLLLLLMVIALVRRLTRRVVIADYAANSPD